MLVLVGVLTPVARSEAGPGSSLMSAPVAVPGWIPDSAGALSALEKSVSVPASAALAGSGSAEPVAGFVAPPGLPVAQAADLGSVSALVLSSGSEAGPLLVAVL